MDSEKTVGQLNFEAIQVELRLWCRDPGREDMVWEQLSRGEKAAYEAGANAAGKRIADGIIAAEKLNARGPK